MSCANSRVMWVLQVCIVHFCGGGNLQSVLMLCFCYQTCIQYKIERKVLARPTCYEWLMLLWLLDHHCNCSRSYGHRQHVCKIRCTSQLYARANFRRYSLFEWLVIAKPDKSWLLQVSYTLTALVQANMLKHPIIRHEIRMKQKQPRIAQSEVTFSLHHFKSTSFILISIDPILSLNRLGSLGFQKC